MNFVYNTLVQKFKGLKNLKAKICPDFSFKEQTLVSGSEDGRICFWKYTPTPKKTVSSRVSNQGLKKQPNTQ